MELTVAVLYRKALAQYTVARYNDGWYEAYLQKYAGSSHDLPPPRVKFSKQGRHCIGDTDEQDLMDDLFLAVQMKAEEIEGIENPGNNPGTPYVSI